MPHRPLEGHVAVVSGSARNIGRAIAHALADAGAAVVVNARSSAAEAEAVVRAIRDDGGRAIAKLADVAEPDAAAALIDAAVAEFGRLDILINNAGILRWERMVDTSFESWNEVVAVNQTGVFLGMHSVAPQMIAQHSGSIVNISSIAGLRGTAGSIAYTASKFAVRGMTKVAALELADARIRVNSIHPGMVDTAMLDDLHLTTAEARAAIAAQVPMGELVPPDAIAAMAVFLASDESSYCTGGEFVVDGGLSADLGLNARV